jgi:ABC-type transport system involved in cytochrome bd biosynthesis fused ATPase/permease subunit
MLMFQNFKKSINLLNTKEKFSFYKLIVIGCFLGILDLISILLVGSMVAISTSFLVGSGTGSQFSEIILSVMNLKDVPEIKAIGTISILTIFTFTVKTSLGILNSKKLFRLLSEITTRVTNIVLTRITKANSNELKAFSPEEIAYALKTGSDASIPVTVGSLFVFLTDGFLLVTIFALLVYIQGTLALFAVTLVLLVSLLIHRMFYVAQKNLGKDDADSNIETLESVTELLSTLDFLSIANTVEKYEKKVMKARAIAARTFTTRLFYEQLPKYIFEMSIIIICGALVAVEYLLINNSVEALSILAIFLLSAARISPSILRIQAGISANQNWLAISEKFQFFNEIEFENRFSSKEKHHPTLKPQNRFTIQCGNLSYLTSNNVSNVLTDINLYFQGPGLMVITGESGSGKTTLLKILLGLLKSSSGFVSVGDSNGVSELGGGSIAYVPQETVIVKGSLKDNLIMGVSDELISDSELVDVLKKVNLYRFANEDSIYLLTKNHMTLSTLSGGEKQRVGIARALLTNPSILFLDEPTSSLDEESAAEIFAVIKKLAKDISVVCISHQKIFNESADYTIELSGGLIKKSTKDD